MTAIKQKTNGSDEKLKTITVQVSDSIYEILATMASESYGSVAREVRVALSEYITAHVQHRANQGGGTNEN